MVHYAGIDYRYLEEDHYIITAACKERQGRKAPKAKKPFIKHFSRKKIEKYIN
jgi:hypothetical protein